MVDPDIRRLLDTVFNVAPTAPPDISQLRAAAEIAPQRLGGDPLALPTVTDSFAPGDAGPIAVRVYRPASSAPLPACVYAHGGGWVTGSLDSHDRLCRILAATLPAIVVAVDYRCAPEYAYPAALDDVEAAWRWTRAHADALGADGVRFMVAGDSSGGNLAAALTLRLRAIGASQPALQLLLYPALDAACSRASYAEFDEGYNLSAAQMRWYWQIYCAGASIETAELSPLAADDLAGLPPAVIAVAAHDVLRDDGVDYAQRLQEAGVPMQLIRCEGMIHGFLRWTGAVPASHRWIDEIAAASRRLMVA